MDRKILADLAVRDPNAFSALVKVAVGDAASGSAPESEASS